MNDKTPAITVLMPAYNAENYIAEAIASILCQTFADFELLIINDGSTDATKDIILSFQDSRIRMIDQENKGISTALNIGLQHARADYIARFDADDICFKDRLQKQFDFLLANPDYIIVGSDAVYISETGDHLCVFECKGHTHEEIMKEIYTACPLTHSSVMFKKGIVMRCGGYPVDAHTFEDYLLWIRLCGFGKICNFPEPLIKVRFSPSSVTIDEQWRGRRFRKLKTEIIKKGFITKMQGNEFLSIIKSQNTERIKKGAYHALCGKKYLINNHEPLKAREHIKKAISTYPLRLDNYVLLALSYSSENMIQWLYKKSRKFA